MLLQEKKKKSIINQCSYQGKEGKKGQSGAVVIAVRGK
jgi:hypothetical protein